MLPVSLVDSACNLIEAARPMLVNAILADLYQNSFWQKRFDDYGRDYAHRVTHYHLNYLVTAIKSHEPVIFADYFAWNRPALVVQGACTHHMHEFIDSTARPVALVLRDGFPLAEPCFAAAHRALEYEQPACRALSEQREAILRGSLARLGAPESRPASDERDMRYHLSYLEDAAAMGKPELFRQHVEWERRECMENDCPPAVLATALRALRDELEGALPLEFAAVFTAPLQTALDYVFPQNSATHNSKF